MEENILKQIKAGAKIRVYDATGRFEGIVLARKHGKEDGGTFTVRAEVAGVGMEKIYPINSPAIKKLEIISSPKKVNRSKIYYIRGLSKKKMTKKIGVTI
ncbi:MAG: 50S ribosomal protein L19 [Candidatus Pacebacteria bacterium]|nr:50S ribosomal protein L19 [Candidatus Paceibacterota bacterium]